MSVPPAGRPMSVRVDAETSAALQILAHAGMTPSEAMRYAVQLLADAHYNAWDVGAITYGLRCKVTTMTVAPYDTYQVDGETLSYAEATARIESKRRKKESVTGV